MSRHQGTQIENECFKYEDLNNQPGNEETWSRAGCP